jgi:hypothetical protein
MGKLNYLLLFEKKKRVSFYKQIDYRFLFTENTKKNEIAEHKEIILLKVSGRTNQV